LEVEGVRLKVEVEVGAFIVEESAATDGPEEVEGAKLKVEAETEG
jgi:hypothetical protein